MHVEEFGGAPVQAHTLALVELALAVVVGDALALAHLVESAMSISQLAGLLSATFLRSWKRRGTGQEARGKEGSVPVLHVDNQLHLRLDGGNLLCRSGLRTTESQERHGGV